MGGSLTEKSGGCPPDDGPCLLSVPDQCVDDSQCPSRMKCCRKGCFRQCVRRVAGKCPSLFAGCPSPKPWGQGTSRAHPGPCVAVKLGTCPEDRLHCLSPIQHLCHTDSDCRGSSRCCLGACGRDCRHPIRGMGSWVPRQILSLSEPQLLDSSTGLAGYFLGSLASSVRPHRQNWKSGWGGKGPVRMIEELGILGSPSKPAGVPWDRTLNCSEL